MAQFTILEPEGIYADTLLEADVLGPGVELVRGGAANGYDALPDELCARADGLFVFRNWLRAADLPRFARLRVVVRLGVGYDRLDRAACAERGITVCNVPDYGTMEVADHAVTLALALRRGVLLHHDLQRGDPARGEAPAGWGYAGSPLIRRLGAQTFGIVGLGRIGTAAALRARAMGFRVVFHDPHLPNGVERALGIERARRLPELLAQSDVLSLHTMLSPETRGMIGEAELRQLPRDAVVVNTSRGPVLDLDALERALRDGHLAGAGLDVLPEEPPRTIPPLLAAYRAREPWLRGRLVVTPHSAFYSPESLADIRLKGAETMRDVLLEGLGTNVIPPHAD